jgi:hypothetical protein
MQILIDVTQRDSDVYAHAHAVAAKVLNCEH